ncbi:Hypothetical protein POVR1_LOCUS405 [uncultured virus]|nr:Hypothetical protein POVR1_LOCUS405 [uncultured virus]
MSDFLVFIVDHLRGISYVQVLMTEEECLCFLKNYIAMYGSQSDIDVSCDQLSLLVSICITISKDLLAKKSGVSIISVARGKSLGSIGDLPIATSNSYKALNLPSEITLEILKTITLRDLVMLKEVCKNLNQIVDLNMDELVYTTSCNSHQEFYQADRDNLFTIYERGKSYSAKANKDRKFEMRESTHILVWYKHPHGGENALVMVNVDINLVYTVMYFRPEVLQDQESTPYYYGWNKNDLGIMVLDHEEILPNFNALCKFLRSERCFEIPLPNYKSRGDDLLGHQRNIMKSLRSV